MSEVKVNKISPRTNCGTVQLGDSGDTITIPAGATITNNGTQTGFGRTGTVDWDTTAITADPANAVSGTGYFANTTSAAFTITLPTSPSAGDIVAISDYASNFGTNNLTVGRNGSNIEGEASDYVLNTPGVSVTLIYVDATKGWIVTNAGNSSQGYVNNFVAATGGTVTCCGDYKVHTFTSPGTFTVTCAGSPIGSNTVDYMIIGGGGGGADDGGGGGGAGGYRESSGAASGCYTASPLGSGVSALPVTATAFPITVGAGGAGGVGGTPIKRGLPGSDSIFSSITSAGGGGGGSRANDGPVGRAGQAGGSGGGGGGTCGPNPDPPGGAGNTPPVSPPQGNPGGNGKNSGNHQGGGGGGAGASGSNGTGPSPDAGGPGGNGVTTSINFSPVTRGGGGGGGNQGPTAGTGGSGGGGNGGIPTGGNTDGTANTGGGGGGQGFAPTAASNGGSGIVIIRYKYQ
jgi:hypothetical protein